MRVIGGEWRGRRLTAPAGHGTRPTSDKVREAIFDVLSSALASRLPNTRAHTGVFTGLDVLDLYAGSGALGIEALSRGAARCTFIERDYAALRALHANLTSLRAGPDRAKVIARSVPAALAADARRGVQYTLLLADPPYGLYAHAETKLAPLFAAVLALGGIAVIETAREQLVRLPLQPLRTRVYGDTRVTVLVRGVSERQDDEQGRAHAGPQGDKGESVVEQDGDDACPTE